MVTKVESALHPIEPIFLPSSYGARPCIAYLLRRYIPGYSIGANTRDDAMQRTDKTGKVKRESELFFVLIFNRSPLPFGWRVVYQIVQTLAEDGFYRLQKLPFTRRNQLRNCERFSASARIDCICGLSWEIECRRSKSAAFWTLFFVKEEAEIGATSMWKFKSKYEFSGPVYEIPIGSIEAQIEGFYRKFNSWRYKLKSKFLFCKLHL